MELMKISVKAALYSFSSKSNNFIFRQQFLALEKGLAKYLSPVPSFLSEFFCDMLLFKPFEVA